MHSFRLLLPSAALLTALAGCAEPRSLEQYLPAEQGRSAYSFPLDLSDTAATYALAFYGRIDTEREVLDTLASFPLEVCFTAPDSTRYGETVVVPLRREDPLTARFHIPYRSNLRPVIPGTWELRLKAPESLSGLQGFGIILSRN